jgi:hypothetical protein
MEHRHRLTRYYSGATVASPSLRGGTVAENYATDDVGDEEVGSASLSTTSATASKAVEDELLARGRDLLLWLHPRVDAAAEGGRRAVQAMPGPSIAVDDGEIADALIVSCLLVALWKSRRLELAP